MIKYQYIDSGAETMKKLYLVCNSHIDPVWMWDWSEGAATALSTFYQAAELLEESDFIFCHNESLLYEYIEEYDPELFARIQKLVKEGKWKIMGGWYLQPDCNLPSGESFVRQIKLGREYFAKKFGARPTVALNFDSFGHSVGLVQILAKTGYEGYLCCRPMQWDKDMVRLPDSQFTWIGKDGSRVKATVADDLTLYCSGFGTAKADIERKASAFKDKEVGIALWGVGNHGGNPSRKDIREVNEMIAGSKQTEIKHSCPEEYFSAISPKVSFGKSMQPCLIGCYASVTSAKKKNAELEKELFGTEKICSAAFMNGYIKEYNEEAFTEAQKALCKLQFHDMLAGTACPDAEKTSLEQADYALTLLKKEYDKALFAFCARSEKANEGEFPIFVFNDAPYERKAVFEAEYLMPDSLVSDTEQYTLTVKQNGKIVKSQVIKERVNINYDRRKRVAIEGVLPASEVARFDISVKVTPKEKLEKPSGNIEVSGSDACFKVSKKTGLLESFKVGDKELLSGGAFKPVLYEDYPDPWGWGMKKIGKNPKDLSLSECKRGVFAGLTNANLVENGEVLAETESFFESESGFIRIDYKMYKDMPYADVTAEVIWGEKDKALKLRIPAALKGAFIGQIPYASDEFERNGEEVTAQRFIGVEDGENVLYIANDCSYSFSAEEGDLYITLLRGVAYCAHPIGQRQLIAHDRYIPFVEEGKHTFNFRIGYCKRAELENVVNEFVNRREGLNYFPHGKKEETKKIIVENKAISLSACYYEGGKYVLRLFNNNAKAHETTVKCGAATGKFTFGKYEVKTVEFDGNAFTEKDIWL